MLTVYRAVDQKFLDQFISNTMSDWNKNDAHSRQHGNSRAWAFVQPDCGKVTFPAQFVIVAEPRIALATIQFLH